MRLKNRYPLTRSFTNSYNFRLGSLQCLETKPDSRRGLTTSKFKWVTNFDLAADTVPILANKGGRLRWKIENEGFNCQKNGGFELEHAYSTHVNAHKIFYFMLQIAPIIFQLLQQGSLLRTLLPNGIGSAKNLAFRLLEAWRNALSHLQPSFVPFPQDSKSALILRSKTV